MFTKKKLEAIAKANVNISFLSKLFFIYAYILNTISYIIINYR